MRSSLVSPIGVACGAALVLPLSVPPGAAAAPRASSAYADAAQLTHTSSPAHRVRQGPSAVPGSTESLPLPERASDRSAGGGAERGLARRAVHPFSLLGVVWDDADEELRGSVRVRTRALGSHDWSDWQELSAHGHEHGADRGTMERDAGTVRGFTDPLWVGESDGVEIRVRAVDEPGGTATETPARALLPRGLRLELVDPGGDPVTDGPAQAGAGTAAGAQTVASAGSSSSGSASGSSAVTSGLTTGAPGASGTAAGTGTGAGTGAGAGAVQQAAMTVEEAASSAVNAEFADLGATEITELSKEETEENLAEYGEETEAAEAPGAPGATTRKPYIGPRPRIITRRGWGADERLRERQFRYTKTVKAVFVHHSGTGNNYTCRQAPSVLRGIYRYHVKSSGWRDIGYNFAIDKCGNIYEGRAGGVAKPVMGAHTLGFNSSSTGIAVLGSYNATRPPAAATTALARLTAWKLGLHGINPRGKVRLTSKGSNKYAYGKKVRLHAVSGHRDGYATECPGRRLYAKLGTARTSSARYQGRR
ncbi:peptidoglycan recognition protein family protein [Streptomyces sp. NPDC004749]